MEARPTPRSELASSSTATILSPIASSISSARRRSASVVAVLERSRLDEGGEFGAECFGNRGVHDGVFDARAGLQSGGQVAGPFVEGVESGDVDFGFRAAEQVGDADDQRGHEQGQGTASR